MIKEWIGEYAPKNTEDVLSALREIMQEVTLAALSRTNFFEKAAFYGGTALRIFHGLDFSFYVKCFDRPSLFAGKMHALLFRKWKNRVKGRDWYDLEWYIRKGIPLDLHHFMLRAIDTGDWKEDEMTPEDVLRLLREKFKAISFDNVKEDVLPFIKDDAALQIWGERYFSDLTEKLKFQ